MTIRDYMRRRLRVGLAIAFTVGVIAVLHDQMSQVLGAFAEVSHQPNRLDIAE